MNQLRKQYDKEFKKKAFELSYASGNVSEIADKFILQLANALF
ncbi:transposase-like protein [Roseimarinus sediminis]|jgi:transposase